MVPRSSATTFSPAADSSFASMPPVQPRPTSTTSTSFSFLAIVRPLAHVRNADWIDREWLVAVLFDVLIVDGDHAGETDQLPAGFVLVAAVHRVREHAFHHGLVHRGEKH